MAQMDSASHRNSHIQRSRSRCLIENFLGATIYAALHEPHCRHQESRPKSKKPIDPIWRRPYSFLSRVKRVVLITLFTSLPGEVYANFVRTIPDGVWAGLPGIEMSHSVACQTAYTSTPTFTYTGREVPSKQGHQAVWYHIAQRSGDNAVQSHVFGRIIAAPGDEYWQVDDFAYFDNYRDVCPDGVTPRTSENPSCEMPPEETKNFGCGDVGNPCDAASGNKVQREVDYSVPEAGIEFVRTYNSKLKRDLGMGVGWTYSGGQRLEFVDESHMILWRKNGRGLPIQKIDGIWQSDADTKLGITEDGGGGPYPNHDLCV